MAYDDLRDSDDPILRAYYCFWHLKATKATERKKYAWYQRLFNDGKTVRTVSNRPRRFVLKYIQFEIQDGNFHEI